MVSRQQGPLLPSSTVGSKRIFSFSLSLFLSFSISLSFFRYSLLLSRRSSASPHIFLPTRSFEDISPCTWLPRCHGRHRRRSRLPVRWWSPDRPRGARLRCDDVHAETSRRLRAALFAHGCGSGLRFARSNSLYGLLRPYTAKACHTMYRESMVPTSRHWLILAW